MKRPELLAPAGNFESLKAAIEAGCDAVYLSGKLYGARSFANNFSNEELIQAINYSHLYGVKVYVTVNTLVYEDEVKNFIKYVEFLHLNGVDAVIIQDIGMMSLLRQLYPNLEIHASTQMHIHNLEGAKFALEQGITRVVLARETPIELIDKIKQEVNIDLEVFVHGALCISYSGQCLMSSLIGGRSGNRGTCAQCCRQPYDLYINDKKVNNEKYLLSTKDLNTLANIDKLIDCGVDSLKIEGRMKRPEYVFYVVSLYRKAIDSYIKEDKINITDKDIYELKKIFNRQFTKGFLFHELNNQFVNSYRPNHLGIEIGKILEISKNKIKIKLIDNLNVQDGIRILGNEDLGMAIQTMYIKNKRVNSAKAGDIITLTIKGNLPAVNSIVLKTSDSIQLKEINTKILKRERKVNITMSVIAKYNQPLILNIKDEDNNTVQVQSDYIIELGKNSFVTIESLTNQLNKIGNTIYNINNLRIDMDENVFIPVKIINDLRRIALEKLEQKRLKIKDVIYGEYHLEVPNFTKEENLNIYVDSLEKYNNLSLNKYNEIIIDNSFNDGIIKSNIRYKISRVNESLKEIQNNLLVGELGSIFKYCPNNNISTDFSLNVVNSYTVAFLHSIGVKKVTLSLELNDYQTSKIITNYEKRYGKHPNLEIIVKDIPEAMILKYDPLDGSYQEQNKYYLKDKYNNKFYIKRKDNLTYIYNYQSLALEDYQHYYDMGINNIRENSINL